MSARIADLRVPLVLETPDPVADGAGGAVPSWRALGTLWGAVEPAGAGEGLIGTAQLASLSYRVTVRAAPGADTRPRPGQRFRHGTRLFRIRSVQESDAAGRFLRCDTEEEATL
ncbi:MAG: head-tail adaptor protein [Qingshengfaniella sp.]